MTSASEGSPWIWSCQNQQSNTCWRQTPSGKRREGGKDQLARGLKGEWRGLWHSFWKKKISLTKKHKGARLECAKMWLTKQFDFKKVIFTDEKRFKFDGPDGWCTWLRRGEPVVLNKRQMGGGGVMVWGMIFANGNIWLGWLKGRQNSESYKQLLDEKALPRIRREMGNDFVLLQDNCSIHVSKLMKEWMAKVNMTTLEWPARSPDLNLIENVWEMLAQLVYDGPEITKEAQLWQRILGAKKQLIETRRDVIVHMFDHYEERLIKVIEKKGDITDY